MKQSFVFDGALRRDVAALRFDVDAEPAKTFRKTRLFRRFRSLAACSVIMAAAAWPAVELPQAHAEGRQVEAGPAGKSGRYDGVIKRISVLVKKSRVIDVDRPYATALVAEAEIADVVPLSDHSIYIVGKSVGSTRLTIVGEDQRIVRIVEVDVTPDIEDLRVKLRDSLPGADIRVSAVNGGIVLSGVVYDAPTIEKAVAIAKRYSPDAVTNALAVASPQQVMLEVRFVEASRTAARELGLGARGRSSAVAWDSGTQVFDPAVNTALTAAKLLSGTEPFGTMLAHILEGGTKVDVILRALEQRQLVRRLAEPNLVTTSGDTASFLAGGEFPFPVSAGNDKISVEFKQFGVALAFTPTVLAGSLINLKIAPEVSDIDESRSVEVDSRGTRVSGLVVRRANTTVELKDGQSLAIAGLLQHTNAKEQAQIPWIGQVPILGALFRSTNFQNNETDLVIIVTPRLVKPKVPGEKLRDPLDGPMASNDVDFFVNGRAEITKLDEERRHGSKPYGHIIEAGPERVSHASTK